MVRKGGDSIAASDQIPVCGSSGNGEVNFGKAGKEQLVQYRFELQAVACARQELQKPLYTVRAIAQWLLLDLLTLWLLQMKVEKYLFY
ncbi:hypothetical protein F0562_017914 [Nyssa sinensis]|uniref:Uncharacterized protein n=1 Tax=Nyssa sinensis TaxID=561372 RepID=A0A5J4Z822_9ASTE|nr:hypothetical protein F0562_017914 [Nyssa sinensis]